jgi:hypothetical protein
MGREETMQTPLPLCNSRQWIQSRELIETLKLAIDLGLIFFESIMDASDSKH